MELRDVPVVMYHSINDHPADHPLGFLAFSTLEFRQHLRSFGRAGYRLVTLSELWDEVGSGALKGPRLAVLTFDDGFLDNYLVAADILDEVGAKATVFVNPGHISEGPPRTLADAPNAWGTLNYAELGEMESTGLFDIQSHTMTHEFIFRSDKLIDLYTPDKFDRYYWLAWMLDPTSRIEWNGNVRRYATIIPSGYPVFEFDRYLSSPRFVPSFRFTQNCVDLFSEKGCLVFRNFSPITTRVHSNPPMIMPCGLMRRSVRRRKSWRRSWSSRSIFFVSQGDLTPILS
jgi:hypothetical protein